MMDMNMMNSIVINEEDQDCVVGAGLDYLSLNKLLSETGGTLNFPLDPGPGATIGGMASCSCSGSTAVKYGTFKENVLRFVLKEVRKNLSNFLFF